jgi:hypothetical protein
MLASIAHLPGNAHAIARLPGPTHSRNPNRGPHLIKRVGIFRGARSKSARGSNLDHEPGHSVAK